MYKNNIKSDIFQVLEREDALINQVEIFKFGNATIFTSMVICKKKSITILWRTQVAEMT